MTVIHSFTTVQDLILAYPQAFDVLARHGMCESCRLSPPPVPLEHFARKHCQGDVRGLLAELQAVGVTTRAPSE